jgi:hypothetical protein
LHPCRNGKGFQFTLSDRPFYQFCHKIVEPLLLTQIIYENYDTKYNVYDNEPDPKEEFYDEYANNSSSASIAPRDVLSLKMLF